MGHSLRPFWQRYSNVLTEGWLLVVIKTRASAQCVFVNIQSLSSRDTKARLEACHHIITA